MWNAESLSREQIREFLKSSQGIEFAGCGRNEKYPWVEGVLKAQDYGKLSKGERGVVRAYVEKVTGMSMSQTMIKRQLPLNVLHHHMQTHVAGTCSAGPRAFCGDLRVFADSET